MYVTRSYSTPDYISSIPVNTSRNTSINTPINNYELICEEKRPICKNINNNKLPWPIIIMAVVGFVLAMYSVIGPNINPHMMIFGACFIFLWTLMWCLILWVLWNAGQYTETWGLVILPLVLIFLFFMIIMVEW
jgi:hypothetical protein